MNAVLILRRRQEWDIRHGRALPFSGESAVTRLLAVTNPANSSISAGALPALERDVVVIGGGQSALAVSYYLRRSQLSYVVLDNGIAAGGAWNHTWRSLRLFSPAQWSSLPGRLMSGGTAQYPTRDEALAYLGEFESRYQVPVVRPTHVHAVRRAGERLIVETDDTGACRRQCDRHVVGA
jgi:cation diffusion facilitator CzcD-associated flavoprotein CzcO